MVRVLFVALLLCLPRSGFAQTWFPLDLGIYWEYFDPVFVNTVRVDNRDLETVRGRAVVRRVSVVDEIATTEFWNYWSTDTEGRLFLHGFVRPNESLTIGYEPPILWVDPNVTDGGTWTSTVQIVDLVTEQVYGALTFDGRRIGLEALEVPAGRFEALFITLDEVQVPASPARVLADFTPTGARRDVRLGRDPIEASILQWYVDGVGLVQEARAVETVVIRTLLRSNVPSPAGTSSWSELKQGYVR